MRNAECGMRRGKDVRGYDSTNVRGESRRRVPILCAYIRTCVHSYAVRPRVRNAEWSREPRAERSEKSVRGYGLNAECGMRNFSNVEWPEERGTLLPSLTCAHLTIEHGVMENRGIFQFRIAE